MATVGVGVAAPTFAAASVLVAVDVAGAGDPRLRRSCGEFGDEGGAEDSANSATIVEATSSKRRRRSAISSGHTFSMETISAVTDVVDEFSAEIAAAVAAPATLDISPLRRRLRPPLQVSPVERWTQLPEDIGVLICQGAGARSVTRSLVGVNRRTSELSSSQEVWSFLCRARWGSGANLQSYRFARDLYADRNGWRPRDKDGRQRRPHFEVGRCKLYDVTRSTMDLRLLDEGEAVVVVSDAAPEVFDNGSVATSIGDDARLCGRGGLVQIVEQASLKVRQRLVIPGATINCCDVGPRSGGDLLCLGADDGLVRLYSRQRGGSDGLYRPACEYSCVGTEVNDLRLLPGERHMVVVQTRENRCPIGIVLVPVDRPDGSTRFAGGCSKMRGKYIHAIEAFPDSVGLAGTVCSAEDPLTGAFSAMLLDFRLALPCVLDMPITTKLPTRPRSTMLWPLRVGSSSKVYANLFDHQDGRSRRPGTIAAADFRLPSFGVYEQLRLPDRVEDFRYVDGDLYTLCARNTAKTKQIGLYRSVGRGTIAKEISTVLESSDTSFHEDVHFLGVGAKGFAVSYGTHLAVGAIAESHATEGETNRTLVS
eukprot:TRINITY_DN56820_c0_g1_i1.p1 TRINITY_DN56820_c0_g1~~TRINITY_DN56820_c0_g1_i1.p1  ORF type:complete len:595 (+),score=76.99 TRINITY_DN56820_c0_g1_i1:94-1878(+)